MVVAECMRGAKAAQISTRVPLENSPGGEGWRSPEEMAEILGLTMTVCWQTLPRIPIGTVPDGAQNA